MKKICEQAFVDAIKNERMTIEQVPMPYQEEVNKRLNPVVEEIIEEEQI